MINLLDYILDLFRDESHAQAFVANPDRALADAGLSTVNSAQLQSVAATAVPSLAMGGSGDAVGDLQQAVSNHYGFQPQTDFAPTTNITDDHSVSVGMGDITLGDKTSAQGDGAVAVGGSTHGDIVTGDGAVLGNGNEISQGGNIIQTSGHSTTTVSDGNTTGVDDSSTLTHTSTIDNSEHDSSTHSIVDTSVHDSSVHDHSTHGMSLHDNSIHENAHTGLDVHLGL